MPKKPTAKPKATAKPLITAATPIGKAIELFPPMTQIMARYGLACAGCAFNAGESLGDGLRGHGGYKPKEVAAIIAEINEAIANYKAYTVSGVTITQAAIDKVHAFAKEQEKVGQKLRIELEDEKDPVGSPYLLDFAEQAKKTDEEVAFPGLTLIYARKLASHIQGVEIDWVVTPDGQAGFRIKRRE